MKSSENDDFCRNQTAPSLTNLGLVLMIKAASSPQVSLNTEHHMKREAVQWKLSILKFLPRCERFFNLYFIIFHNANPLESTGQNKGRFNRKKTGYRL